MPLIEPIGHDGEPTNRREKIIAIGGAGVGKTSGLLSWAWWAYQANDPRKFWMLDFDDSAGDLLLDEKYRGMTNLEVMPVEFEWESWKTTMEKVLSNVKKGDFIIGDMIDRGWKLVQDWEARMTRNTSRSEELLEAAKTGAKGWDLYKDPNWVVINSQWDEFIKPMLIRSPAHVLLTTEEVDLGLEVKRNEPADVTNARREFGRYKPAGQKSMPFQVRTIVRLARLNRGRTITTVKDRARKELENEDLKPDLFTVYGKNVAGWSVA